MTIEGLGKKFQEARLERKLTLDEAARMTKIRPSRLAEIEADDFSQFPSLTYAKGFLQIYGKFLDVDVSPYMEAFEGSDAVTVDGYSYLQDNPAPKPARTPVVPRRPPPSMGSGKPTSLMPLFIGIGVIFLGVMGMKLILNLRRIAPSKTEVTAASPSPTYTIAPMPSPSIQPTATQRAVVAATAPSIAATATPPPASATPVATAAAVVAASTTPSAPQPEVRRAEPVAPEDLAKAGAKPAVAEGAGPNKIAIRPLKKTYVKVVVDNDTSKAPFERWISPGDGPVEFRGQHFAIRVLDREAVQIKKNGKSVAEDDSDVTIE